MNCQQRKSPKPEVSLESHLPFNSGWLCTPLVSLREPHRKTDVAQHTWDTLHTHIHSTTMHSCTKKRKKAKDLEFLSSCTTKSLYTVAQTRHTHVPMHYTVLHCKAWWLWTCLFQTQPQRPASFQRNRTQQLISLLCSQGSTRTSTFV